jgi:hypothetical protein
MFTGTEGRVHESVAVKIVGQQWAEGEVARQVLIHAPDGELNPRSARQLAVALHSAAAEVQWRDGVDNCEHCDAVGMVDVDGTRVACEHPIFVCSPPRAELLADTGDGVIE